MTLLIREDPSPELVAAAVTDLVAQRVEGLNVYWIGVTGGRDEFHTALTRRLRNTDTVVIVVRGDGFRNPNALTSDLMALLESNRSAFDELFDSRSDGPLISIGVVLVARTALEIPQSSSPGVWPEWVPFVGGKEVSCHIQDISHDISVPLDSPSLELSRVSRALHALERAMVRRLIYSSQVDDSKQIGLYLCLSRGTDKAGWTGFIRNADVVSKKSTPNAYRPSVRDGAALTSRLWNVSTAESPARARELEQHLRVALVIDDADVPDAWRQSVFQVLARPSNVKSRQSGSHDFVQDMLVNIATACQFITSAHHAGDYPSFPIHLARAIADELLFSLSRAEAVINGLPSIEPS